ncbi:MAG: retropepsin-like aspartic protease [Capnocytophaga sp.]|nr:retropepsin-like aspartic protease [Capnocytophaga sp.]
MKTSKTLYGFKFTLTIFFVGIFLLRSNNTNAQEDRRNNVDLEYFLTAEQQYVKIPIAKIVSGHLYVNAVLNGVEGVFILDTGASVTVLDIERKGKFRLSVDDQSGKGAGAGGVLTLVRATNNTLELGEIVKKDFAVFVMDLGHVNNALVAAGIEKVDGVIGSDILIENKAIIDYPNMALYLQR